MAADAARSLTPLSGWATEKSKRVIQEEVDSVGGDDELDSEEVKCGPQVQKKPMINRTRRGSRAPCPGYP